jgi:hypothetical protein
VPVIALSSLCPLLSAKTRNKTLVVQQHCVLTYVCPSSWHVFLACTTPSVLLPCWLQCCRLAHANLTHTVTLLIIRASTALQVPVIALSLLVSGELHEDRDNEPWWFTYVFHYDLTQLAVSDLCAF